MNASDFESELQASRAIVKQLQRRLAERDRVRREGGSASGMNGSKSRDQLFQLEKKLAQMETDLNQASRAPSNYGVTPSEIDRRRGMLADVRRSKVELSRLLNGNETYGSVSRDELLYGGRSNLSRKGAGSDYSARQFEGEHTRERDTRDVLRMQEQMMKQQDDGLHDLSAGIQSLKQVGLAIGEGVSLTTALLDDVGASVDKTDDALQRRTAKAQQLQEQVQGNCWLYVVIAFLVVLLVFNISTDGFSTIFGNKNK